ncbi:glycoside hydrolase family 99-like domain-containing protein [Desulforudis sp. 1088]|uniref:glycoside hydrolase family 99-like domain-containing protein n=1 Tax=unclassified Candidatus Desulforudis TaxID=2635950 RepID=UPI003CE58B4C
MPKISVILTSFNHEKYLREAIDSALNQTYGDFELIIWDDASTDESWFIINSYKDSRIKAFRNKERKRGVYGINKAIREIANGDYIAIHHSDDVWESHKLERQVKFLDEHPDIGAVFTNALAIGEDGAALENTSHFYYSIFEQPNRSRHEWLNRFFYNGNALCHPSVLIRRQCYIDCGLYRPWLAQVADFDMWIRLCFKYNIHVLPEKLVRFRVRENEANTSGNRPDARIRGMTEFHYILRNYLLIDTFDEMVLIFPEAREYFRLEGFESQFVLAMICLGDKSLHWAKLLGLELLFELLSDAEKAKRIKNLYSFDYRNFIELTAIHDVFSLETVANLSQAVAEREAQIASLTQAMAERDGQIASLTQAMAERDAQIANLTQAVADRDERIAAILASRSWRITKPLRVFRRSLIMRPYWFFRCLMSESVRWIWRHLPIPDQRKQKIKSVMFKGLPFLFGWTQAYRSWQSFNFTIDRRPATYTSVASTSVQNTSTDSEYAPLLKAPPLNNKPVKLICFYLPQFHPIPENDAWWGEGFTEWTNVLPAQPQFIGHYQPHVPDEPGCYNLLDPAVQRRQIELAKLYGIEGFCFYFYWFDGKRLLETPIQNYLNDNSLDLPFCLCWANENWTRRWDGLDSEILIAQQHSPEDDLAFIRHVAQYMRDPRYIRIDGKPLLLVYRPSLLPSAKDTAKRWRNWCRENGIGEIYLAYTQSFKTVDPAKYGFDAAVEFPPNNSAPPNITNSVTPLREDFGCTVYDWRVFVERSEKYQRPRYKLFRSVCPSWDNTARRKNRSTVFLNSSPALYQRWLENAIRDTLKHQTNPDERLVFINAWNEWAEGAHLEPDQRYGYAWLQATRDALVAVATTPRRIVVVSHDAHPHGAQLLALHMARELCQLGFSVDMIVLGNGVLLSKFQQVASVHRINLDREPSNQVLKRLRVLRTNGAEVAIVNTTVSGRLIPLLKQAGFVVVSLIHELPGILNSYQLHEHARAIADNTDCIVFPAAQVKAGFEDFVGHLLKQAVIRPQGLYLRSPLCTGMDRELIRSKIRKQLGLASDTRIILSAGYADYRKGLDLFIDACLKVINQNPKVVALWVGHVDQKLMDQQMAKIDAAGVQNRFIFPGRVDQPQEYFIAADVYALTSREDPFPSVVLEAYDALTPVVAFKGCGGFEEFLKRDCGVLVPAFDIDAYAKELMNLIEDQDTARRYAEQGRAIVEREFSFRHYLFDLLEFAGKPLPRVSVILPNYNYGRYLTERLSTIVRQTVPIYELIVLDDASTDDSLQIARDFLAKCDIPSVLVVNERNSGSVFSQWIRGVDLARGDFVWIAEADDLADPEFLESVLPAFQRPNVVMSYAQSRQMAEDGTILCEHYLDYVADIDRERWTRPYVVDGKEEIKKALYLKNTIPNVSAVVFRRNVLAATLKAHAEEIASFRFAGDWVLYLRLLEQGAVAFCPLSLNSHRRHQRGVTIGGFGLQQLQEIIEVQRDTIQRFELDAQASLKASAYAQRLYEQFGFANHTHPTIQDHPEFEKLMYI